MLRGFLTVRHVKLVDRCQMLAAARVRPRASCGEIRCGVPVFLAQVIDTRRFERAAGLPDDQSTTASARKKARGGKTIASQKITTPASGTNGQR